MACGRRYDAPPFPFRQISLRVAADRLTKNSFATSKLHLARSWKLFRISPSLCVSPSFPSPNTMSFIRIARRLQRCSADYDPTYKQIVPNGRATQRPSFALAPWPTDLSDYPLSAIDNPPLPVHPP